MGLCGSSRCGCGLTVGDGLSLTGSGEPGDPFVVSANPTWQAVTPAWTNLTVGNGTNTGQVCYVPGGLRYQGIMVWGSTTSISGSVGLTVPLSLTARAGRRSFGSGWFIDSGTGHFAATFACAGGATLIGMTEASNPSGGGITATIPFTWTTGDIIEWDITIAL